MAFAFEKLIVYQKSVVLADQISSKTEEFPSGSGFLCAQINRESLSIVANIAEGSGRFIKADRPDFFIITRGSIQECVPLLEMASHRNLVTPADHESLK